MILISVELSLVVDVLVCCRLASSLSSSTKHSRSDLLLMSVGLAGTRELSAACLSRLSEILLALTSSSRSRSGIGGGFGAAEEPTEDSLLDESEVAPLQFALDTPAEPDVPSVDKLGELSGDSCLAFTFGLEYKQEFGLDSDKQEGDRNVDRCCLVSRWLSCCWLQVTIGGGGGGGARNVDPVAGQRRSKRG